MQSEERELITGLFGRLQPFESQQRDGEAETLIRDLAARQPAAPYLLVQTVLVQEQALKAALERIAELESKSSAASAPAASGFLGTAPRIGPWGSASPAASAPSAPPRMPVSSTRSPLQAAVSQQPAGGSFLRTAMATAAGVAGGALLFQGIRGLMDGNAGPFGGQQAAASPPSTLSDLQPPDSTAQPQQQDAQQAYDPDGSTGSNGDYDSASYESDAGGDDSWA